MNRRAFLSATGLALVAAPLAAEAQQTKVYRIGLLLQGSPVPPATNRLARSSSKIANSQEAIKSIFPETLHNLGYTVGRNLVIDLRWAEGQNERFPGLAVELVALNSDVIVADSTPAAIAAKRATATIPIVMVNVSDPVGSGLVTSLAHPGSNVTGTTDYGTDLALKGLELMHDLVPTATRIAVLMSDNPVHPTQLKMIQDAAKGIGLMVLPTMVRSLEDFETAFASMAKQNAGALIVLGGAPVSTRQQGDKVCELAAKTRLPTWYPARGYVARCGLLSYGPTILEKWSLTAAYVAKIFKGAKPADLPVEQPTTFELVINLKTAKALVYRTRFPVQGIGCGTPLGSCGAALLYSCAAYTLPGPGT